MNNDLPQGVVASVNSNERRVNVQESYELGGGAYGVASYTTTLSEIPTKMLQHELSLREGLTTFHYEVGEEIVIESTLVENKNSVRSEVNKSITLTGPCTITINVD